MLIRDYQWQDCEEIVAMFKDTVINVNCRDYDDNQLQAWISGADLAQWHQTFMEHKTLVAIDEGHIVGFADMDYSGFLDRLYVHKNYQHRHIGTKLCDELEAWAWKNNISIIRTHASITAKPFYEKRGYKVIQEQLVRRGACQLKNYIMEKMKLDNKKRTQI